MSSSRNSPTTESAIVADLVNYNEATMRPVFSSSVATVLIDLKARYWGDNPSEEKKSDALSQCIKALKALPEYNDTAYKADIDFIIAKIAEPNDDLDKVSLYFPERGQLKVTFPLSEVLPLVWEATQDSLQFIHHYEKTKNDKAEKKEALVEEKKEKTKDELKDEKDKDGADELAAAQNDLPNRILTFLNRLRELRTGICHHGVRNGLVSTLSGTYKGIDILEDERAAISYFLKDRINEAFWKRYQETKDEHEKERLMPALFTWMNTNNPREVLALIDPNKKLFRELHQLFIHHHIDPQYIRLDNLIEQALNALEFEVSTSKEHDVLRMMNRIMNSVELDEESPRGKALSTAQEWIKNHCSAWKDEQFRGALTTFYSFYFSKYSVNLPVLTS